MSTLCIDHLGLAHKKYPVKLAAKLHPAGWGAGAFDDIFGPLVPAAEEFIENLKGKHLPLFRIQADWSNHRLVSIRNLKKRLPTYEALAKKYSNTDWYVSHSCEYDSKNEKQLRKRLDLIEEFAPSCIPISAPSSKGIMIDAFDKFNERHGELVAVYPPFFVSMDGTDITDINVKQWLKDHKDACAVFGWRNEFNGRVKGKPPPPINKRTNWPTKKDIQYVIRKMKGR